VPVKVVIIESSEIVRASLEKAFNADPYFSILCSCNSLPPDWERICVSSPDIVLLDADLPEKEVVDFLANAVSAQLNVQVMIMVESHEHPLICIAFRHGAGAFLLKSTSAVKVIEAARDLYKGGAPMSPLISKKLLDAYHHTIRVPNHNASLSQREKDILILLSEGLQYKEIAARLSISPHTVRQHLHHIYSKLEVQNKTEAINKGLAPEG
jgi:DNA-binding NarL/FixJ family response regulator